MRIERDYTEGLASRLMVDLQAGPGLQSGDLTEEEGKVWLVRSCPEAGKLRYVYWSDPAMYHRFERHPVSDELHWINAALGVDHLFINIIRTLRVNKHDRALFFEIDR